MARHQLVHSQNRTLTYKSYFYIETQRAAHVLYGKGWGHESDILGVYTLTWYPGASVNKSL